MTYAVIDTQTNVVVNMVLWNPESTWQPPEGTYLIQSDIAKIGDTYDPATGQFVSPPVDSPAEDV